MTWAPAASRKLFHDQGNTIAVQCSVEKCSAVQCSILEFFSVRICSVQNTGLQNILMGRKKFLRDFSYIIYNFDCAQCEVINVLYAVETSGV